MNQELILASGSEIRAEMLRAAGVPFRVEVARIDESSIRASLEEEGATPRDIADTLAEYKARRVSDRFPEALVLGCDQTLDLDGRCLSKPETPEQAREQLQALRGNRHMLLSAVVGYRGSKPEWRHVGTARLWMRNFSDTYLDAYLARNWDSIRHSVGGYKMEEEGVRLFSRIEGDHFTILGLPMFELLAFLSTRGIIET